MYSAVSDHGDIINFPEKLAKFLGNAIRVAMEKRPVVQLALGRIQHPVVSTQCQALKKTSGYFDGTSDPVNLSSNS